MTGNQRRLSFYSDPRVLVPLWVVVLAGIGWFGFAPARALLETARVTGIPQTYARWIGAESLAVDPMWASVVVGAVIAIVGLVGAWAVTRGDRRPKRVVSSANLVELDPIRRRG